MMTWEEFQIAILIIISLMISGTADDVLALFLKLCHDKVTLVLVTHDPTIARAADRVIEMRDGLISPTISPAATTSEEVSA